MAKDPVIDNIQMDIDIKNYLTRGELPNNLEFSYKRKIKRKCEKLEVIRGQIYFKMSNIRLLNVYDWEDKTDEIKECHGIDHVGINLTQIRVRQKYDNISREAIQEYIGRCKNCQRESLPRNMGETVTPIIPSYVKERLLADLIDLSCYESSNNGYKYLYTFIDSFSKFAWVYKAKSKCGQEFSEILERHISVEGKWKLFHTDNGKEFINRNVHEILNYYTIKRVTGRPYHPQSQGQIERFNRTLKSRLRKSMQTGNFNYLKQLNKIVYNYNNSPHRATKIKPSILYKGTDDDILSENLISINRGAINMEEIRAKMVEYCNKFKVEYYNRQNYNFSIGDQVFIAFPYNVRKLISGPLGGFYEIDKYEILNISEQNILVKNLRTSRSKLVHKTVIKKIL